MYLILAKNRKNPALQLIHSEFCKWLYSLEFARFMLKRLFPSTAIWYMLD